MPISATPTSEEQTLVTLTSEAQTSAMRQGDFNATAKSAIRMLKGIIADLPAVATLVEAGNKLLPAIAQLFAL